MQRRTKLLAAGGLAVLLGLGAIAGLAHADMEHGGGWGGSFGHGMRGMWGMMGFGPPGPGPQQLLERYDANKDGKVTQQEIDTNRAQWLADFDADKNGTLSLEEFRNLWLKARQEMMVREFQFLDRDGNGQVTADEYGQPFARLVAERDRNGDGALSPEDAPWRGLRGRPGGHGPGMPGQPDADDDGGAAGDQPPPPPAP